MSQLHIIPPGAVQSIRVRGKKKKSPVKRYTVVQKHWVDLCGNVIQRVIMFRKGLRPQKKKNSLLKLTIMTFFSKN